MLLLREYDLPSKISSHNKKVTFLNASFSSADIVLEHIVPIVDGDGPTAFKKVRIPDR